MDRAECNACNAVILMSFSLITITLKRDWQSSFAGAKSDFGNEGGGENYLCLDFFVYYVMPRYHNNYWQSRVRSHLIQLSNQLQRRQINPHES